MKYEIAKDLQQLAYQVIDRLGWTYIKKDMVSCVRSKGSQARGVIARVHSISKAVQLGMNWGACYVIEFLERYDKMSQRDQIETVIHELLHIPKVFGGGFRHHDHVTDKKVRKLYDQFMKTTPPTEVKKFKPKRAPSFKKLVRTDQGTFEFEN